MSTQNLAFLLFLAFVVAVQAQIDCYGREKDGKSDDKICKADDKSKCDLCKAHTCFKAVKEVTGDDKKTKTTTYRFCGTEKGIEAFKAEETGVEKARLLKLKPACHSEDGFGTKTDEDKDKDIIKVENLEICLCNSNKCNGVAKSTVFAGWVALPLLAAMLR